MSITETSASEGLCCKSEGGGGIRVAKIHQFCGGGLMSFDNKDS